MSILIKGIDMPKTPKTIVIYPNGTIVDGDRKGLRISKAEAVEIPTPHGRLIDADETRTQYYQTMEELLQSSTTINISAQSLSLLCGLALINNAPTILEAEE